MPMFIFKKLTGFFILVALLLVPLHSVAHDVTTAATLDSCACQLMTTACSTDDSGHQSDQSPADNSGDCCDSEGCAQDAVEPPVACDVRTNISESQLFYSASHSHIPTVYLAIFVPPER